MHIKLTGCLSDPLAIASFSLPSVQSTSGTTVLCDAAEAGYEEVVAKLLEVGADPDLPRTVSL